jgi:phosphohistidine phosphatase
MGDGKLDLFFFRHGPADWPNWRGDDDDRPLTEEGKRETHEVAAFLAKLGVKPQKIITSPLPRASQTADIAAEHLRAPLKTSECLAKGFNVRKLKELLDGDKIDNVMLVGHEPDFGRVIEKLTGGDVKLKKTGVARVRLDRDKMSGQLLWLLPPAVLKASIRR